MSRLLQLCVSWCKDDNTADFLVERIRLSLRLLESRICNLCSVRSTVYNTMKNSYDEYMGFQRYAFLIENKFPSSSFTLEERGEDERHSSPFPRAVKQQTFGKSVLSRHEQQEIGGFLCDFVRAGQRGAIQGGRLPKLAP